LPAWVGCLFAVRLAELRVRRSTFYAWYDLSATETEVAVEVAREFRARLMLHHDCAAIPPGIARQWDWEATHGKTDSEAQAEWRGLLSRL
jgi:hypothetical protein